MKKSLTAQELAEARRQNSIMLGLLFAIIAVSLGFAFGTNIIYVIAIFALPVAIVRGYEEINRVYSTQKPQRLYKRK